MPELPEVETIKTQLEENIIPFKIEKCTYSPVHQSILKEKEFELEGLTIEGLHRHGKMLEFHLSNGGYILSHFGMSGSWRFSDKTLEVKHNHFILEGKHFGKKYYLNYVDPRRFGNMYYYFKEKADRHRSGIGADVSTDDFNFSYLKVLLKKFPQKQIKPFLLEQKYFGGIGNYMASEICARAGIRPTRRAGKVTQQEMHQLIDATSSVVIDSIKNNGTTFSGGYSDAYGDKGEGVQNLVVFYQKTCGLCKKNSVKKIVLATRGTYYCPHCQR